MGKKTKKHDNMESHLDYRRLEGLPTWVASIPKGFSSHILALKLLPMLFLLFTSKKEYLVHVLTDENLLFLDVIDVCLMVWF